MLLELDNVSSGYGDKEVLHSVSMGVRAGEVTCIFGPNGSGKSTLLKTIAGVLKPTQGKLIFEGKDITGMKPHEILKRGIALVPQGKAIFPYMTVTENLRMGTYVLKDEGETQKRINKALRDFPLLKSREKQLAGTLSGGEQAILTLARALEMEPKVILMDEPSLGLSPKILDQVYDMISEMRDRGMTLVLVEQNVRKGLTVAKNVFVLVMGQVALREQGEALQCEEGYRRLWKTFIT